MASATPRLAEHEALEDARRGDLLPEYQLELVTYGIARSRRVLKALSANRTLTPEASTAVFRALDIGCVDVRIVERITDPELQAQVAGMTARWASALALNPHLDPEVQLTLATGTSDTVRSALATNPHLTPEAFEQVFAAGTPAMVRSLQLHPLFSAERVATAFMHADRNTRYEMIHTYGHLLELQEAVVKESNSTMVYRIVSNTNLHPSVVDLLIEHFATLDDTDPYVEYARDTFAANTSVAPSVEMDMRTLECHPEVEHFIAARVHERGLDPTTLETLRPDYQGRFKELLAVVASLGPELARA